ncbi:MAG: DUF309 domain-containing protein [Chloroflexota bacterium]
MTEPGPATVLQAGRRKAYRPLPSDVRRTALAAGIAAYEAGDYFLAHELLEPAWMGTDDPVERDLHQGVIKLAAAFVHEARGNPLGIAKNLRGARTRLAAATADPAHLRATLDALEANLDLVTILEQVDAHLASLASDPGLSTVPPVKLRRNRA